MDLCFPDVEIRNDWQFGAGQRLYLADVKKEQSGVRWQT